LLVLEFFNDFLLYFCDILNLISAYLKKRLSKNKVFDFSYRNIKGSAYMYCKVHCRFIVQTYKKDSRDSCSYWYIYCCQRISGTYYRNVTTPLSIGYINLLGFFVFVPVTMVMARLGAKAVYKIDKKLFSKIFGTFLIVVSVRSFIEYLNIA
jgi:hypothetical protein